MTFYITKNASLSSITLRFLLALFFNASLSANECPAIPPVYTPDAADLEFQSTWQSVAEPHLARYAVKSGEKPNYGIGNLNSSNSSEHYYDWMRHVTLPLWSAPDESTFYGWLHGARVHPAQDATVYPLTGAGLVETDYEFASFIVYEALDDGWLRIKLKPGSDGYGWTHQCHLGLGKVSLTFQKWESFLKKHGEWLHFRSQVPHSLRKHPNRESTRVTKIGLDHKLIFHEFNGDWMRVTVEQPDNTCNGESEQPPASVHTGWVKWRDTRVGPWVWVYARGC